MTLGARFANSRLMTVYLYNFLDAYLQLNSRAHEEPWCVRTVPPVLVRTRRERIPLFYVGRIRKSAASVQGLSAFSLGAQAEISHFPGLSRSTAIASY